MIRTEGLKYNYHQGKEFTFPDIEVGGGEAMLILGQSGIGKTTLLHLLGGLMAPKSGQIFIANKDITQLSNKALDQFRGKHISIIFQQNHFIQSLSVIENLKICQELSGNTFDKKAAMDYLSRLGMEDKAKKYIKELSQGERQRVAIIRAMINKPSLILADEPTSALDDMNTSEVCSMLMSHSKEIEAALLVVTHDARLNKFIDHSIKLS
jgi:putative ABC transport system ATP-binding protein